MKKKAIILISLLAVMSFNACSKAADGVKETPAVVQPEEVVKEFTDTLYSSVDGSFLEFMIWGNVGKVEEIQDASYGKVLRIASLTSGWGNIAFQNVPTSALSNYNQFEFKVKSENGNAMMIVHLMGKEKAFDFTSSYSTSLGGDWYKVTLPFSALTGTSNNDGQVAFIVEGAGKELLMTDVKLSTGEPVVAPPVVAPTIAPASPNVSDVNIGLYTDVLGTKMINMNLPVWRDNVEDPEINFSENKVKALTTNWVLYELSEPMNADSNTTLYMQVWTAEHNAVKIKLADFKNDGYTKDGDTEFEYTANISQNGEWVQLAIPLSTWKNNMTNFTDINQIILTPVGSGTMYIDNIYIK